MKRNLTLLVGCLLFHKERETCIKVIDVENNRAELPPVEEGEPEVIDFDPEDCSIPTIEQLSESDWLDTTMVEDNDKENIEENDELDKS